VVVAPMAFQAAKQHSGLVGWLLVGVAIAPPIVFVLSPPVNRVSDVWLHEGIRIATPEVRAFGRTLVPSQTLFELEPLIKPAGEHVAFAPLAIAKPYFFDESPAGSYDLTLIDPVTDSVQVDVPAPCGGTVIDTGWHGGYGNQVDIQCHDGHEIFLAHFSQVYVATGDAVKLGQPIAQQGSTGNSTGEHVHIEITPQGGERTNREQTLPIMQDIMALWETGLEAPAPAALTLDDETLMKAIGKAEGTVDGHLHPDADYHGHSDPGNGAANLGFFSYQHGASSPQEADQKQLQRLRKAEREIQAQAVGKFGQPLSEAALLTALDLWNQAPLAGQDFVRHLATHDPTPEQIVEARAKSYIDPTTGALDAPGLGNSMGNVKADQHRRTKANLSALQLLRRHPQ
jgi:hypothetical protein